MEICKVIPAVLCSVDGKSVRVQVKRKRKPSPSHHQLVTVNTQADDECVVQVYDIEYEKRPCMAFCFEVGNKAIFPFTDGKDIKCTVLSSQQEVTKDMLNETFLFQWGEEGSRDWRSLKSVAEPSMYLFFEDNDNKVTIKPVELPLFRIEKKDSDSTRTPNLEVLDPKKSDRKTQNERFSLVSRNSKHGPSFCEATAISTKSTCRQKRKPTKMRCSLKA